MARKNISEMTCFASSGMQNLTAVLQRCTHTSVAQTSSVIVLSFVFSQPERDDIEEMPNCENREMDAHRVSTASVFHFRSGVDLISLCRIIKVRKSPLSKAVYRTINAGRIVIGTVIDLFGIRTRSPTA